MDASSPASEPSRRAAFRQAAQLTSLLGLGFAILFTAGMVLLLRPAPSLASNQALVAFYASGNQQWINIGGLYLIPFAAVAFLWFIAALRQWAELSERPVDHLLSTVQSFSGVGFIILVFAAAGAVSVIAASMGPGNGAIDPVLAKQFPLYGRVLLLVFGLRMAAIFVMATTNIGQRAKLYPRWFVLASYLVAAVLLLTASLNRWLVVVFPLWIIVLCGLVWLRARADASLESAAPEVSRV